MLIAAGVQIPSGAHTHGIDDSTSRSAISRGRPAACTSGEGAWIGNGRGGHGRRGPPRGRGRWRGRRRSRCPITPSSAECRREVIRVAAGRAARRREGPGPHAPAAVRAESRRSHPCVPHRSSSWPARRRPRSCRSCTTARKTRRPATLRRSASRSRRAAPGPRNGCGRRDEAAGADAVDAPAARRAGDAAGARRAIDGWRRPTSCSPTAPAWRRSAWRRRWPASRSCSTWSTSTPQVGGLRR